MTAPRVSPQGAPSIAQTPGASATIARRVGAYAIDVAVATAILVVLGLVALVIVLAVGSGAGASSAAPLVLLAYAAIGLLGVGWALVYTAMQGGRGSIGQRILGLQLRDADSTAQIGFWRAVLRNVIWSLAASIIVGYFTPLFDPTGRFQGWHDKVARAVVIDVRGVQPTKTSDAGPVASAPVAEPPRIEGSSIAPLPIAPLPAAPLPAAPLPSASLPAASLPAASLPNTTLPAASLPVAPRADESSTVSFVPLSSAPQRPSVAIPVTAEGIISAVPGVQTGSSPPGPSLRQPVSTASDGRVQENASDGDLDETRVGSPTARAVVAFTWDNGTRVGVYGRTLFGRNPACEEGATTFVVRDETLSLSKTHFEIDADESGTWIIDRHSTNGSILVRDGVRRQLAPGTPMLLHAGDRLEFGDRSLTIGDQR